MRAANEQLAFLSDITFGPTAIIAAQIERRSTRRWLRRPGRSPRLAGDHPHMLIDRCENLKVHLDNAIDSVEAELGLEVKEPSAQREYEPEQT